MIVSYTETYGNKKVEIGDKVVITQQINRPYYCITVGHVLIYMGNDKSKNPGDILKDEETGLIINHVSVLDYQYYEPSIEIAEKKYINKKEKQKFLTFIKNNCLHSCGKTVTCGEPKPECIEYVHKKQYKDNPFILKCIRKMKMVKLEKC